MAADANELEQERCPACGAEIVPDPGAATHRARHNDVRYTLRTCARCELKFWSPLRADASIYAQEGFEAYVDYHSGKRPFPRWAEPLFEHLPQRSGDALDIGCGDGSVLRRLADLGFTPHGIDLDERSIAVARDKFRLSDVTVATLDQYVEHCAQQGRVFDLITFFEVLEHQDAPHAFLQQVARIAKPGATVAGSVPNRDRFLGSVDRRLNDGDLPPHHFLWFSAAALTRLLTSAGFEHVSVRQVGALGYRTIVGKLRGLVEKRTGRWPGPLGAILTALCAPLALVPWLGLRAAPSHLFFSCRTRGVAAG